MRENPDLVFSLGEYKRRIDGVRAKMQEAGLDYLIVTQPDNLLYLTGHETSGYDILQTLILPLEEKPFSLTRKLEQSNMLTRTWVEECLIYEDFEDSATVLAKTLKERCKESKTIGYEVEGHFLPYRVRLTLETEFGDRLVNASGVVESMRILKSAEEISLMEKVAKLTQAGMVAGIEAVKVGTNECDIAAAVHHEMYKRGSHYPSVPPYISSGPRTNIGHATWIDKKIGQDECVFLEHTACLNRYHAPMMRTVYAGKAPANVLEGADIVINWIHELKEKMKPGITAGEIDDLTQGNKRLAEIGATKISRTGYGMGIAFAPAWDEGHVVSLRTKDPTILQESMTFHLIPWIQFPKDNAVITISETVVVEKNGARSLFDLPLDLVEK